MSIAVWNCQSWELNVTKRGYIWQHIWVLHLTSHLCHFIWQVLGGVYLTAYLGTSSDIWSWSLHLTSLGGISDSLSGYFIWHLILVTSSDKFGGYIWQPIWVLHLTSDLGHFIWQVAGGYIWTLHLFWMGSHWQHRSAKNSPPGTSSLVWGGISELFICFE